MHASSIRIRMRTGVYVFYNKIAPDGGLTGAFTVDDERIARMLALHVALFIEHVGQELQWEAK